MIFDPSREQELQLIEPTNQELSTGRVFDVLSNIRAENVWLANFTSPNTKDAYARAVGSFIASMGIETPEELYSATQAHVIAWRSAMENNELSASTIARNLAALSSLFKHLTDERLATQNPVSGVKRPKTGNNGVGAGVTRSLTKRQVEKLLTAPSPDTLQGLRDRALLKVYCYSGARVSEPLKMKVKDLRPDRDYMLIDLVLKGGKRNTVAINPDCVAAIRDYLEVARHGEDPDAFLFQPVGRNESSLPHLSRTQIYRLFEKYGAQVGLEDMNPHVARATFISLSYDNGTDGEDIRRTVGHSSITTTEGYNHTARKHKQSASLQIYFD